MSQHLWDKVRMAWTMLSGQGRNPVREPPPRHVTPPPRGDEPRSRKEGFTEEALPWLDAVYRFAIRLTNGDHRFWHRYERGTNAKSWLFTICRNTFLHEKELARNRREHTATELDTPLDTIREEPLFHTGSDDPERSFYRSLIDDEVVAAIDGLPPEFKDVLVLSDLGDLRYAEIAEVLNIPVGTVKSRLFRARNLLQSQLKEFAARSGYLEETAP